MTITVKIRGERTKRNPSYPCGQTHHLLVWGGFTQEGESVGIGEHLMQSTMI